MTAPFFDIVIPTIGRPSLAVLLQSLAESAGPPPAEILVVDDRVHHSKRIDVSAAGHLVDRVRVLHSEGHGPAAARNLGWRSGLSEWVAFLDDDVIVSDEWLRELGRDISVKDYGVGATTGRIIVPLPDDRLPTDWERNVAGLEQAQWATADMAYRRSVLEQVGGFDERFPRAYREDADLGLRVTRAGYEIPAGNRYVFHPVRPADRWVSVRLQRGNADDALMPVLHGSNWRHDASVPTGRFSNHVLTTAVGGIALAGFVAGKYRFAAVAGGVWLLATGRFAWERIAPGPRDREEISTMVVTSAVIPPVAVWYRIVGMLRSAFVSKRTPVALPPARQALPQRAPVTSELPS